MKHCYTTLLICFFITSFQSLVAQNKSTCASLYYAQASTIQFDRVQFNWSSMGSTAQYELRYRTAGAPQWTSVSSLTTSGYTLTGLTNNTTYEWQARTICAPGDSSAFSATQVLRTQCYIPNYLSTNNVTFNSAQLYWSSGGAPYIYELQWRAAGASDWNTQPGIISSAVSLTGLSNNTTYEWRVRTTCSPTEASDFAPTQFFRTQCLQPSSAYTSTVSYASVGLSWSSIGYSAPFEVQWRPVGATDWNSVPNLTNTNYTLTGLSNSTTYEWRVRTVCSPTEQSAFTTPLVFQTRCTAPFANSPSSVKATSVELSWYAPESGLTFELQWKPRTSGTWTTVSPLTTTSYSLTGLTLGATYDWQVRAICTPTAASSFVTGQSFQTTCTLPTNPAYNQTNARSTRLSWSNDEQGISYDLQWRSQGATDWTVVPGLTQTVYFLTGLSPNTMYEYQVRRVCSPTVTSAYTTNSFQTACYSPNSLAVSRVLHTTANVYWNAPVGFDGSFEVQWRSPGSANWSSATGISESQYTINGLTTGTTYEWRVRSVCSTDVTSSFSQGGTFSTQCGSVSPFFGTALSATSVRLGWFTNSGVPARYEVQWRLQGNASWTTISDISGTEYVVEGLTPWQTYEYRVRAICSADVAGAYSNTQYFNTTCDNPTIRITNITPNSTSITWNSQWPGDRYTFLWRQQGSSNWTTVSNLTNPTYRLTMLNPGAVYEVSVARSCAGVGVSYGSTQYFQAQCQSATNLYTAEYGADYIKVVWSAPATEGTRYTVRWRVSGTTDWLSATNLSEQTYTLPNLANNTTYEWQVITSCLGNYTTNPVNGPATRTSCRYPTSTFVEQVNTTSARLRWNPARASDNLFDIQWRATGQSAWNTIPNVAGNAYTLSDLTTGTSYTWRIRTVCSAESDTTFTYPNQFTPNCYSPYSFYANTESTTSATVYWDPESYGASFTLQWRQQGTTNWTTITDIPVRFYRLTGLNPGSTYEIQLQGICSDGQPIAYNGIRTFSTYSAPSLVLTTKNITSTGALLTWTAREGTSYRLQWRAETDVNWQTVDGLTGSSYQLSNLTKSTQYVWRLTPTGQASTNNLTYFLTQCLLPSTVLINQAGADFVEFNVIWGEAQTPSAPIDVEWRLLGATTWNNSARLLPPYRLTGLATNTLYEYRMRTICGSSDVSITGLPGYFQTSCPRVYMNQVTTGYTSAQLTWNPTNYNRYIVQWRQIGTTNWQTVNNLSTNSYLISGLSPFTIYEYRVGIQCTDGITSDLSTLQFQTQCPAPSALNVISASGNSATVTWTKGMTDGLLELQWRQLGQTEWQSVGSLNQTTYTITGLVASVTYEWRVTQLCSSEFQNVFAVGPTFKTNCSSLRELAAPYSNYASPTVRYPSGPTSITVTFADPAANGRTFRLRYRPLGTANWTLTPTIASWPFVLSGLEGNTQYEWQYQTACEADGSEFVGSGTFVTEPDCPSVLYTVKAGNWNEPNVWSCNRVPTANEAVRIRHLISIPGTITGRAGRISYETGGKLRFRVGARVRSGQ